VSRPCVFLSAGEASGDLYLARVARALRARRDDLRLVGVVGPHGREAGVEPWAHAEDLAVMGFGEVVRHLPRLFRLGRALERRAVAEGVDLFLPVDYPGFHVRLAGRLRRHGIPTLDFIPPKTWSWARWRLGRLRASVERCAVIFPFEVEHYGDAGIDAVFVGHPLVDAHAEALRAEPPAREGLLIAPGSRRQELERLAPVLAEGVRRLSERAGRRIDVRVSRARGVDLDWLRPLTDAGARPVEGTLFEELRRSEVAVVCSGTATVEAALAETPHVIVYRTGGLSYRIARWLATVEHIGMANIVLGRRAFPELLQEELTPRAIADHLHALFLDPDDTARERQRSDARELRRRLGEPGCFERVAELALARLDASTDGTD
jgi:lipid-A-disaccharide synthase